MEIDRSRKFILSPLRRLWLAYRPEDLDATCIQVAIVWVLGDKILGFEWLLSPDEAMIPSPGVRAIVLEMPRHLHWLATVAWPEAKSDRRGEDRDLPLYLIETLAMAPLFVLRMDRGITMNPSGLDEVNLGGHANEEELAQGA